VRRWEWEGGGVDTRTTISGVVRKKREEWVRRALAPQPTFRRRREGEGEKSHCPTIFIPRALENPRD
jgi:hypothetical protein